MDIIQLIDARQKTRNFTSLASQFVENPQKLEALVKIALSDMNYPYPEYASWLLLHVAKLNATLLEPFLKAIIDRILTCENQSTLRNLVASSTHLTLIEYKEGKFLDRLIAFVKNDENKVALIVYSIYKLIDFTLKYPEIKHEIVEILKIKQENGLSPALKIGIRNYTMRTKKIDSLS
jgi:hypothetical protein